MRSDSTKSDRIIITIVLLYFLPYIPGTTFRLDQFIGLTFIVLLIVLAFRPQGLVLESFEEKLLVGAALLSSTYISLRFLVDLWIPLKVANYQYQLLGGAAIWVVCRKHFLESWRVFLFTLLILSVPVNLYSVFQYSQPNHWITDFLLLIYNGPGEEFYSVNTVLGDNTFISDHQTIAAIEVLSGTSMTSIFTGKHSLAMFCCLIITLASGALRDPRLHSREKMISIVAIVSSVIGGVFSTSKIFIVGAPILGLMIVPWRQVMVKPKTILGSAIIFVASVVWMGLIGREIGVVDNILNRVLGGDLDKLFITRYGEYGYFADAIGDLTSPLTLLFGHGSSSGELSLGLADSQFRSVLLLGGIPYFLLYFAFILFIQWVCWVRRWDSAYAWPFFSLGVVLLLAGSGIEVYWQARVASLWVICQFIFVVSDQSATPEFYWSDSGAMRSSR